MRYSTVATLTEDQAKGKVLLDLGQVVATAEVHVNGEKVGVRVAPPWRLDVSGHLKPGENKLEVVVYNTLANHYQTIPSRYRGLPLSGLIGPVRLLSRDWKTGDIVGQARESSGQHPASPAKPVMPTRTVTTTGNIQITISTGPLQGFDKTIRNAGNLMCRPGLIKSLTGTRTHSGGGTDFSALTNGTAGNGKGKERTENDGRTFVGMGEGNTLDIIFDPTNAPKGVAIHAIHTYANHHDARASQKYTVFAALAVDPDRFVKIAVIDHDSEGGLSEAAIRSAKDKSLVEGAARLRFLFHNCSLDFSVYREIAVFETLPGGPASVEK